MHKFGHSNDTSVLDFYTFSPDRIAHVSETETSVTFEILSLSERAVSSALPSSMAIVNDSFGLEKQLPSSDCDCDVSGTT